MVAETAERRAARVADTAGTTTGGQT